MERGGSKIIAIVALCVGVVGLSLGFAAFSNTLTISSSASVTPDASTFSVAFDTTAGISCTPTDGASINEEDITLSATTISDVAVEFTKPASVTCTATAKNMGQYIAYLKSISTDSKMVTCAVAENADGSTTTESLMNAACSTIEVTVSAGDASDTVTTTKAMNKTITQHSLAVGTGSETVTLKIDYKGPALADGNFTVSIPDVILTYSSVD